MDDVTVAKLDINNISVYAKVTWKKLSLDITLLADNECWSGSLNSKLLKDLSDDHEESETVYFDNLKLALNSKSESFTYELNKKDDNTVQFVLKKIFKDGTLLRYAYIILTEDSFNKDSLIEHLINVNTNLKETIRECIESNTNVNRELEKCKQDWEQTVQAKELMEKTLYSKFAQILNTKKVAIKSLEDTVKKFNA